MTMQKVHILHCIFLFYNCTNCDQLQVKICPDCGRLRNPLLLPQALINYNGDANYICFHTDIVAQYPTISFMSKQFLFIDPNSGISQHIAKLMDLGN